MLVTTARKRAPTREMCAYYNETRRRSRARARQTTRFLWLSQEILGPHRQTHTLEGARDWLALGGFLSRPFVFRFQQRLTTLSVGLLAMPASTSARARAAAAHSARCGWQARFRVWAVSQIVAKPDIHMHILYRQRAAHLCAPSERATNTRERTRGVKIKSAMSRSGCRAICGWFHCVA